MLSAASPVAEYLISALSASRGIYPEYYATLFERVLSDKNVYTEPLLRALRSFYKVGCWDRVQKAPSDASLFVLRSLGEEGNTCASLGSNAEIGKIVKSRGNAYRSSPDSSRDRTLSECLPALCIYMRSRACPSKPW
jgi:hypothetical protein